VVAKWYDGEGTEMLNQEQRHNKSSTYDGENTYDDGDSPYDGGENNGYCGSARECMVCIYFVDGEEVGLRCKWVNGKHHSLHTLRYRFFTYNAHSPRYILYLGIVVYIYMRYLPQYQRFIKCLLTPWVYCGDYVIIVV